MIVEFTGEVLADAGAHRHLTTIFWMTVDGRHRWYVQEPAIILGSPWFRDEGARVQRRIREQLDHTERHVHTRRIVVARQRRLSPTTWALPPAQAERLLRQPVHVLVENADSDGTFLRAVLLRCGRRGAGRPLFVAVGGCRTKRAVQQRSCRPPGHDGAQGRVWLGDMESVRRRGTRTCSLAT